MTWHAVEQATSDRELWAGLILHVTVVDKPNLTVLKVHVQQRPLMHALI